MKVSDLCDGAEETLAMAAFPMQEWCEPYKPDTALCQGTLFPCLNLKFHAAEESAGPLLENAQTGELSEREKAMNDISAVGFAVNDLTLYLDTHPGCRKGIALMRELLQKRLDGLADFAARFYPLTQLSIVTGSPDAAKIPDAAKDADITKDAGAAKDSDAVKYEWDEGPMPWEGGLV